MVGTKPCSLAELWACDSVRNYAHNWESRDGCPVSKQSSTLDEAERKQLVYELERKMLDSGYKVLMGQSERRELIWNALQAKMSPSGGW